MPWSGGINIENGWPIASALGAALIGEGLDDDLDRTILAVDFEHRVLAGHSLFCPVRPLQGGPYRRAQRLSDDAEQVQARGPGRGFEEAGDCRPLAAAVGRLKDFQRPRNSRPHGALMLPQAHCGPNRVHEHSYDNRREIGAVPFDRKRRHHLRSTANAGLRVR
ncbi:hypothetical protein [Peristeroidobacter agariperforans]|uniref:hypothetical protein n=1 Tax=Peristeroidobacter agariperforans TaxID=268404 RepID=UPI0018E54A12|nr:hypothetical protein [Peristeroidobacter agariperforans]